MRKCKGYRGQAHTLNWLQEVSGGLQSSVRSVISLRLESHGGSIAASSLGLDIISSRRMPRQSHEDRSVRPIIIIILLLQPLGNLIIHLLVILEGRLEWS